MTTIISGNFQQQDQAQQAMAELQRAGFAIDQTTTFFVNPPGQHDRFPVGGSIRDLTNRLAARRAPDLAFNLCEGLGGAGNGEGGSREHGYGSTARGALWTGGGWRCGLRLCTAGRDQ